MNGQRGNPSSKPLRSDPQVVDLGEELLFQGRQSAFIMELPLYHLPNWRTIGLSVWRQSWAFVQRAGTVILVVFRAHLGTLQSARRGD